MSLILYSHPFSSYCQKVLTALYENGTPFEARHLEHEGAMAELEAMWPHKRFPVLKDGERVVIETSVIIEYLDQRYPGATRFIPSDPDQALEARFMDRFFDLYVGTPQGNVVFNAIRPEEHRDPYGVTQAKAMLEKSYKWLDARMADREWAVGDAFSLADCAAAPHLFYADWTHPIDAAYANVHAYRRRLLARPSFARAVDEARMYRHYFPLGAPDRD
jgi:glutathione S-transferase